jgi:hypothetical protein
LRSSSLASPSFLLFVPSEAENPHGVQGRLCEDEAHSG